MRLIDADDFKVFLQSLLDAGAKYDGIIELLDKQPMVYNVNKVVERLKDEIGTCLEEGCEQYREDCDACRIGKVIEIVRSGGI